MKWLALLAAASFLCWGATTRPEPETVVIIGGDTRGNLSPCGCTKPMTGGIRRRMTAVSMLTAGRDAVVLENGGLVAGTGRQAELKLSAMAEALKRQNAIVAVSPEDAKLGSGPLLTALQLSGGRMIATSVADSTSGFAQTYRQGPFTIGALTEKSDLLAGVLGGTPLGMSAAADQLMRQADGTPAVVLLDGDEAAARKLAESRPELKLIVFSLNGSPLNEPIKVGQTWLVTPGERGRYVIRLVWKEGRFESYAVTALGPEIGDDPDASRTYATYLRRVDREKLIDQIPRRIAEGTYAGSKACASCHSQAYDKWKTTGHAHALDTLEKDGHGTDPECVTCHVVDLDRLGAYVSKYGTPDLASVGCESCHGPSGAHVMDPAVKTPRQAKQACVSCHNVDTSPQFSYDEYWQKIEHK